MNWHILMPRIMHKTESRFWNATEIHFFMNTQLQGTSELIPVLRSKWNLLKVQNYGPSHRIATVLCSWRKCHSGWSCLSLSLLCSGWFSLSSLALPFHVNVQLWDKSPWRMGQQANIQTGKHHQGTCPNRTDPGSESRPGRAWCGTPQPLPPLFPSPGHLALSATQKLPSEHLDIAVASTLAIQ